MAVNVYIPPQREKRDLLDLILGGLQAASLYTNITKARQEIDEAPEAKKRLEQQDKQKLYSDYLEVPGDTPNAVEMDVPGENRKSKFLSRNRITEAKTLKEGSYQNKKDVFDNEEKLRSQWLNNPQTKSTQDVATSATKIGKIATSGKGDGAGDMTLLYSLVRMLDPGTGVKEGEYASAQNTRGIPDDVLAAYNKASNGDILTPDQRVKFAQRAGQLFEAQYERQKVFDDEFVGLAQRNGLSPNNVVLNLQFDPTKFRQVLDEYVKSQNLLSPPPGLTVPKEQNPRNNKFPDFDINEYLKN